MASSDLRRCRRSTPSPVGAAVFFALAASCATAGGGNRAASLESLVVDTAQGVRALPELLSEAPATVFVFWSAGCPCVRRYQARVDDLADRWRGRVAFVAVSSNADETLQSAHKEAAARGVRTPLVRDASGAVAAALDAHSTPTVVLVRRDGTILYRGWVDNERLPGESGREPWLEDALEGFASGRPFSPRSPVYGCTITRSLLAPAECHSPPAAVPPAVSEGSTP
jgi:hypothetical protein